MIDELPKIAVCLVLILIILEYIYITNIWKQSLDLYWVLILIILEYIYISCGLLKMGKTPIVLILIILEYIYIKKRNIRKDDKCSS